MPTTSKLHSDFIRSMKKKYDPRQITSKLTNDLTESFTRGVQGFTGKGPDNRLQEEEAAGVVHEGEVVTSAPDVRAAGGPEALIAAKDKLVAAGNEELPGFRRGGLVGPAPKRRGYQNGDEVKPVNVNPDSINTSSTVTGVEDVEAIDLNPDVETKELENFDTSGNVTGTKSEKTVGGTTTESSETGDFVGKNDTTDIDVPKIDLPAGHTPEDTEVDLDNIGSPPSQRAEEFEELQDNQIAELENIAAGTGTASGVIGNIARDRLAGQIASGNLSQAQADAQLGVTGSALTASRARQRRNNSLAQTGLEGQLAIDAVNRSENAVLQLANIAQQGQQFEEMKRQFGDSFDLSKANFGLEVEKFNEFKQQFNDNFGLNLAGLELNVAQFQEQKAQFGENMDLAWDKLGENIRQFDDGIALTMFLNDSDVNRWAADTLLLAGDTEGAANIYKDKFNIDVDYSTMEDANAEKEFGSSIANLIEDLNLIPADVEVFEDGKFTAEGLNTNAAGDLVRGWNAQHPDDKVTLDNANKNAGFTQWAENTFSATKATQSPYYSIVNSYTDDELGLMIAGVPGIPDADGSPTQKYKLDEETGLYLDAEGNEFEYLGIKGIDGVRAVYSNLFQGKGLTVNADDSITSDFSDPTWEIFGLNETDTPETGNVDAFLGTGDFTTISKSGLLELTSDQKSIDKAVEAGYIDAGFESKDAFSGLVDLKRNGTAATNFGEFGITVSEPAGWSDSGVDNPYEINLVGKTPSLKGPTVLIGGSRYELRGIVQGGETGSSGKLMGYTLDAEGNRTTDKPTEIVRN